MKNKIETHFIFDESLMLHILGENNFPDIYSPFIELIKNAYDANIAKNTNENHGFCSINIDKTTQTITIKDNGIGMDEEDLLNKWLIVGKSDKKNDDISYQGDKGIGRIAIHKIAKNVILETKKINSRMKIVWNSNWHVSNYYKISDNVTENGTIFILTELKQIWTDKEIEKLKKVLQILTFNVPNFDIYLNNEKIENNLENEIRNEKYEYLIEFFYDSIRKNLNIQLKENEFDSKIVKSIIPSYNDTKKYNIDIPLKELIKGYNKQNKKEDNILYDESLDCGSFSGIILFRRGKTNEIQSERFHYINKNFIDTENGIMIYRDGFIVRPFGISRKNDFFDISGRARRSPATQTKDDARWRVRLNNITGIIHISKNNNPNLIDQSNRNGFEENKFLEYFKVIVDQSIDYFERTRQKLTVEIDKFNKRDEPKVVQQFEKVISTLQKRISNKSQATITNTELNTIVFQKQIYEENIENNNYDTRRMIYYTTQGLLTLSRYHEIKNNCDFIENFKLNIIDGLKYVQVLDELTKKFKGVDKAINLFSLIDDMQRINDNNSFYSRKILDEEQADTFENNVSINELIDIVKKIKETWESKIYGIRIKINEGIIENKKIKIKATKSDVFSIIDNLILNTTEINNFVENYEILISIEQRDKMLMICYENTGRDLAKKFQKNPNKIFEYGVKDETKKKGHGIGMWILKKTIDINEGECIVSKTKGGFGIDMFVPLIDHSDLE